MFRNIARGLALAGVVFVVFGLIDDFVLTLAGDLFERTDLQYAFRAAVASFGIAFVGAYFARQRVALIAVGLATTYWVVMAVYRYSTLVSIDEISFVEFVVAGLRSIIPSILFCYLGAVLGWKYYEGAHKPDASLSRSRRTASIAIAAVVLLGIAPAIYSYYWKSQAVDQVRIAVRAIQSGEVPDNVYPFKSDIIDLTQDVEDLVQELTPNSQFIASYKSGEGFHSYEVEIWPNEETMYMASASYQSWDGWHISCCLKDE